MSVSLVGDMKTFNGFSLQSIRGNDGHPPSVLIQAADIVYLNGKKDEAPRDKLRVIIHPTAGSKKRIEKLQKLLEKSIVPKGRTLTPLTEGNGALFADLSRDEQQTMEFSRRRTGRGTMRFLVEYRYLNYGRSDGDQLRLNATALPQVDAWCPNLEMGEDDEIFGAPESDSESGSDAVSLKRKSDSDTSREDRKAKKAAKPKLQRQANVMQTSSLFSDQAAIDLTQLQ